MAKLIKRSPIRRTYFKTAAFTKALPNHTNYICICIHNFTLAESESNSNQNFYIIQSEQTSVTITVQQAIIIR